MANDTSGFGLSVIVRASKTFPQGITITQFADDGDPIDSPAIALSDKGMGLNGDLVVWSKATPIEVTLNLIPNSDDDLNMSILAEANRVGKGKKSARDTISFAVAYPDGRQRVLTGGKIMEASVLPSIASAGKMKSKAYKFAFENKTGAPG